MGKGLPTISRFEHPRRPYLERCGAEPAALGGRLGASDDDQIKSGDLGGDASREVSRTVNDHDVEVFGVGPQLSRARCGQGGDGIDQRRETFARELWVEHHPCADLDLRIVEGPCGDGREVGGSARGVDVGEHARQPRNREAEGHRAALDCLLEEPPQLLSLNLGSGRGISVLEVIQAFAEASKRSIPHAIVSRRPGDAAITVADPAEALRRLGWQTQRSLQDICRDGWAWQAAKPQGYASEP